MPEYLAPGVYMEEVSFRSKSIEGVPTSTTGFVGMTRAGPVQHTNGPKTTAPRLVTSFTEFERVYGGLEPFDFGVPCYVAHAARAFFNNGGKRLYISRVFVNQGNASKGVASLTANVGAAIATWTARWPGRFGNVAISATPMRSKVAYDAVNAKAKSVGHGTVVEVLAANVVRRDFELPLIADLRVVFVANDGTQTFYDQAGNLAPPGANDVVNILEMKLTVLAANGERADFSERLAGHPRQTRYIGRVLDMDDPEDENSIVALQWTAPPDNTGAAPQPDNFSAAGLLLALLSQTPSSARGEPSWAFLAGGDDGQLATAADIEGLEADLDNANVKATGLAALGELDDIAIVAAPDVGAFTDDAQRFTAAQALVTHAESLRYRIAIVDGPMNASMNRIRAYRGQFDSKYAALYHPWIEILDPLQRPAQGAPPKRLLVPPSGFVAGIYARSDIERGVHKAPANEIVRGLTRFEININKARQDVLNPEGVNALRFFEGRGNRVWGARTMSSDPEWKYVNVRRLFIYIEHSIDKNTQWAVFEPNNRQLWDNIRSTVEDFLLVLWLQGALLGDKPEEAYFVRCDRTTMTQNDLDNGRLVCLVGLAPTKPAEFVIFRVGQWTADAKQS